MRRLGVLPRVLVACALALSGLVAVPQAVAPAGASTPGVSVMGPSTLNGTQIANWFRAQGRTPKISVSIEHLANLYVLEGAFENVRGDLAFAQSIVETGYFGFVGSMVQPAHNNYAGMGACDSCTTGVIFPNAQTGVRAQIQHLRNYADISSRAANLAHPPVVEWYARTSRDPATAARNFDTFFAKGRAPLWTQMGNGNWATAPHYASAVLQVYNRMLAFNGLPAYCPPDSLAFGTVQASFCPAGLRHPGRAVARNPVTGGYYTLAGDGVIKAVNAPYFGAPRFGFDIARDIAVMPDGQGYIVLDGWGGLHRFGSAASGPISGLSAGYWPSWDIARSLDVSGDGRGLVVLDGFGGLHARGTAVQPAASPYWPGWDIARSVVVLPDGRAMYVLDGFGAVHALGGAPHYGAPWFGWDIARDITTRPDGGGYAVLDGYGGVHRFAWAVQGANPNYVAADRWRGIVLQNVGYAVVRNDGYAANIGG